MRGRLLLFFVGIGVLGAGVSGCRSDSLSILDRQLDIYRFEQEKYRREDLEEMYREESRRCEELTDQILDLRDEIALREEEFRRLTEQLAEIEIRLKESRAEAEAAAPPAGAPETPASE